MIFSKATGYGILAAGLARQSTQKKHFGLEEVACHEQIPPVFCAGAGRTAAEPPSPFFQRHPWRYELARRAPDVTLWEMVRLLDTDPNLDMCVLGRGICTPETSCPFHEDWQRVRQGIAEQNHFVGCLQERGFIGYHRTRSPGE